MISTDGGGNSRPDQWIHSASHPSVSTDPPGAEMTDTPAEVDYYTSGGILPYVLNQILA